MPSKEALSRLLKDLYRDEEQIKGIIQASPLAVAIFDSRGMCVFLNRSCMELFGIKDMKSLRHRNLLDPAVISGKTKEKLLRGEAIEIEAVLDPSKAQELGLPKARKGGLRLKVLMNAIMRGKEKKPEGFIVRMAGLTERKGRGEEFEMIVEGSTIPMFVLGKDHKVSHWNKAMEALTGLRKGEIIGTDDQWRLFYPSKRPILADLLIDRARDEEIAKLYKNKYRRSSLIKGAYEGLDYFPLFGENGRWIHFSASPLKDAEGGIIGAIETAQDVTETKQYEKQIKALKEFSENIVESAPIGIIVVDLGKKVTACNKAHGDIYWMDKEKALERVICRDCMKELGGVIEPLLEKAITAGKTSQLRGLDYSAQGVGRTQTLDILISPLVTDNEITGAVMITKDVTERRLLKERVRVLEKKDLPLTEKDKTVLYGLVRYPEYNDIELAKKLRIKRSTLTSIKNKLSRAGFYTTLRIPNLPVLGYELVSISYGNFVLSNDKEEKDVFKKELAYPEYVSIQSTGLEYYAMMVSKNITKYKEKTDPLETEILEYHTFPLQPVQYQVRLRLQHAALQLVPAEDWGCAKKAHVERKQQEETFRQRRQGTVCPDQVSDALGQRRIGKSRAQQDNGGPDKKEAHGRRLYPDGEDT
jgi:PAS domain S-box-containing protein